MSHPRIHRKLIKIGNSVAIQIPKAIVQELGILREDPKAPRGQVALQTDGRALLLKPLNPEGEKSPKGPIKDVAKVGNGYYVYLDRVLIQLCDFDMEEELEVISDGKNVVIQKHPPSTAAAGVSLRIQKVIHDAREFPERW